MRIAFITGGLEGGVADYTRSLAKQCELLGHPCCIVALYDAAVTASVCSEQELRLPALQPWRERIALAQQFLDRFAVDWLSFQFVCFGFDNKGLVHQLLFHIQPLLKNRNAQVMFHELWVNHGGRESLKFVVWGALQRFLVLQFLARVRPQQVHTSNMAYLQTLKQEGVEADILPLFGSIPIGSRTGDAWLFDLLNQQGFRIDQERRSACWLMLFFGALHPIWPPEALMEVLEKIAMRQQKRIAILHAGRIGPGESLWETLVERHSKAFTFLRLGTLTEEQISELFLSVDFGISATQYQLLGKSSSVIAMLEHGLPVIAHAEDYSLPEPVLSELDTSLILHLNDQFEERLLQATHQPRQARLPRIAQEFLNSLQSGQKMR
jgi:hypothetical protein